MNKLKKIADPPLVIAILLTYGVAVLCIGVMRGESSIFRLFELRKSQELLDKAVQGIEAENQSLNEEITKLRKSKNYARKVLRDRYHVTDPDENIVFFPD